MVTSFKDIPFTEIKEIKDVDKLLQEHLNISLAQCAEELTKVLAERADELSEDFVTLAPHGDYGKLMEDPQVIAAFLRDEASKAENWEIEFLDCGNEKNQLLELVFSNKAVDDGDNLKGFVFVGLSGKIRHAFPQVR